MLPLLCCWSALMGRLSVLECAFWGFLLLFELSHLFLLLLGFQESVLQRDATEVPGKIRNAPETLPGPGRHRQSRRHTNDT